jgi:hypothetical protein
MDPAQGAPSKLEARREQSPDHSRAFGTTRQEIKRSKRGLARHQANPAISYVIEIAL